MSTITTRVTTDATAIPALRHRDTVLVFPADQDDFVTKYEANNDHLVTNTVPEFNAIGDQMNLMAGEMNTVAGEVNTNATTATAQATISTEQAVISTTKAGESSASATASQLERLISEAEAMTAEAYATTPLNTFVTEYTSDGDGTFTGTATTKYSALHWAATIDDINKVHKTESIVSLLSENPLAKTDFFVENYHAGLEGGGGIFVWNPTAVKNTHNGGTIIDPDVTFPTDWTDQVQLQAWFDGSANVTLGCWIRKFDGPIDASKFGAKTGGAVDNAIPVQTMYDNYRNIDFDKAIYLIGSTITPQAGSTIHFNGANLTADPAMTTPIIDFNAVTNCNIYDMILNGAYSTTIPYLMNLAGSQYNNFFGCHVQRIKIGVNVGDDTDTINSENHFFGLTTYDCVVPLQTRGFNTQIFLNGCILVGVVLAQYPGAIPHGVANYGGGVIINGGACQTPAATTGSPFYMEPTPYVVTVSTPNSNRYGRISAVNCSCETAGSMLQTSDAGILTLIDHGAFQLSNCGSFTTNNTLAFIFADSGFTDIVSIKNCRFISQAARTAANMTISNPACKVDTDRTSWEDNFLDEVDGIVGGTLIFENDQIVLNAADASTTVFAAATLVSLDWTSSNVGARHIGDFDGREYTVPVGGFKKLLVEVNAPMNGAVGFTGIEYELLLNGVVIKARSTTVSINNIAYAQLTVLLRNLVAGDSFRIRATGRGAAATTIAASTLLAVASN